MAPRRKNASIKSTGATSSKAEALPEWVKNKSIAKPPPKHVQLQQQQQQQQAQKAAATSSGGENGVENKPPRPPPLFPPGTKTPINLLNERIQKHYASQGWVKPNIEARKIQGQGQDEDADGNDGERWTFVVTLIKTNKADQSNPFTVRFDSKDPSGLEGSSIQLGSKEEAKHYGATYALFRLCSTLSLYQVLPTGPREYWKTLATHKSTAPDHLSWLWAADPFEAAQKVAAQKQARREQSSKKAEEAEKGPRLSRAWLEAREVRMAKDLRDQVEATVRKALQVYPSEEIESTQGDKLSSESKAIDTNFLQSALAKFGFRKGYTKAACEWLKEARHGRSTSTASLASVAHLSDLDACLEYLTIFCPEDDLPPSFAPSSKADSFVVSSASVGQEETLAVRWIEDRLAKLAGYPRAAVKRSLAAVVDHALEGREGACVEMLLHDLCEVESIQHSTETLTRLDGESQSQLRLEERETVEAILGPERVKDLPPSEKPLCGSHIQPKEIYDIVIAEKGEDVRLRICPGPRSLYPREGDRSVIPSFFVTSSTLPAYLKLALSRRLGRCLLGQEAGYEDWGEMLEGGQGGVILAMVEELETCWQSLTEEPPELAVVMKGVTAQASSRAGSSTDMNGGQTKSAARRIKASRPPPKLVQDGKTDASLKSAQAQLWQSRAYTPFGESRANLPAMASKDSILSLLEKDRLVIIAGETGCGKTTQCPQFVLDAFIESGQGSLCNIIVTQPRRLSAMGVASRVAAERCEELNGQGQVGYAIRGERKAGKNTRLLFSTTGVLLRRLSQQDRNLEGVSHIFVDEVHERGVESDLLLLELRQVLQRNPSLRVILMSATIDQETFSRYFNSAPILTIPGRTHPVTDFYLEDIKQMLSRSEEQAEKMKGIDYDLIGSVTRMICERATRKGDKEGAILIFCPGVGEIRMAMEAVQREMRSEVDVLPLHANLMPEEQRMVFKKARPGMRKVIVSTNVAETSITIDDVVYVVDLGLVKETRYDATTGLTRLIETRCSKAASRQRRGRAGRVRPGECFKLYSRNTEEFKMDAQQIPEMRRMALENLICTIKSMKEEGTDIRAYLDGAISPPDVEAVDKAMMLLEEMSILQGQKLTALGKHVSLLPLDVRLAKMLVLGCIFHCLDTMLTIAAIVSCKPLFSGAYEKREEVSSARLKFQEGSSDLLTDANAYQQWILMRRGRASSGDVRRWCEQHFLSASSLRDVANTRLDLLGNLIELGFAPLKYGKTDMGSYLDANSSNVNLKRSMLLAGFYPSVIRIAQPRARYDQAASGTVQRESEARQVRYLDASGQRFFLHPSSTLFSSNKYQSDFLTYFSKTVSKSTASETGEKIYLRDANEVPIFAMLLFGGKMKIHRSEGGISMSSSKSQEEGWIKLRASARIATLVQHLRFLLEAALEKSFDDPTSNVFEHGLEAEVRDCLQSVLEKDGLS